MTKIRVILDGGNEFVMECKKATMKHSNATGKLVAFEYIECTKNIPLYIDVSKVAAVIQEDAEDG